MIGILGGFWTCPSRCGRPLASFSVVFSVPWEVEVLAFLSSYISTFLSLRVRSSNPEGRTAAIAASQRLTARSMSTRLAAVHQKPHARDFLLHQRCFSLRQWPPIESHGARCNWPCTRSPGRIGNLIGSRYHRLGPTRFGAPPSPTGRRA
jgi:hypothetical protein